MNHDIHYPLRSWALRDFKSVADADIDFAPLTVLVGANSAGKSTVMQSLLMVAQAADDAPSGGDFPLNGPLVELGDFADVCRAGCARGARISVACTVVPDGAMAHAGGASPDTAIRWSVELDGNRTAETGAAVVRSAQLETRDVDGRAIVFAADRLRRAGGKGVPVTSARRRSDPLPLSGAVATENADRGETRTRTGGLHHRGGIPTAIFSEADGNLVRVEVWVSRVRDGLLGGQRRGHTDWDRIRAAAGVDGGSATAMSENPETIKRAVLACDRMIETIVEGMRSPEGDGYPSGARAARLAAAVTDLRRDARRGGFADVLQRLVSDRKFVDEILDRVGPGEPVARPAADEPDAGSVVRRLQSAGSWLADFMAGRIVHLGPLRQDPQQQYPATQAGPRGSVGAKGEFALAVLHKHARRMVICPLDGGGYAEEMALSEAVNYWLGQLGLGCSVTTVQRPRLGLEPQVRMENVGRDLGLTGVGVGVSQILPVLVLCLVAEPGSVVLLEQPELHLHPGIQQRLGDFLLACVESGRQVIVETHSDHLVTRLRRRIAEDDTDSLCRSIAVVFAEREGGRTTLRTLEPNRFGGLELWPAGFFDGGAEDARALVESAMRKRD